MDTKKLQQYCVNWNKYMRSAFERDCKKLQLDYKNIQMPMTILSVTEYSGQIMYFDVLVNGKVHIKNMTRTVIKGLHILLMTRYLESRGESKDFTPPRVFTNAVVSVNARGRMVIRHSEKGKTLKDFPLVKWTKEASEPNNKVKVYGKEELMKGLYGYKLITVQNSS